MLVVTAPGGACRAHRVRRFYTRPIHTRSVVGSAAHTPGPHAQAITAASSSAVKAQTSRGSGDPTTSRPASYRLTRATRPSDAGKAAAVLAGHVAHAHAADRVDAGAAGFASAGSRLGLADGVGEASDEQGG